MELSSADLVRAFIAGPRESGRPQSQLARRRAGPRPSSRYRKVCVCGICNQCLDNARWERIFAEKFADPDYYAPRATRLVSPLTDF